MKTDEKDINVKGYNGWTNYETWLLSLNLNNSPEAQEFALRVAVDSSTTEEFKLALEEWCYMEDDDLYKIEDRWLHRDWMDINFHEVWQCFREDAAAIEGYTFKKSSRMAHLPGGDAV